MIVGVFNIILFFKLWGMTSDVRKLRDFFLDGHNPSNDETIERERKPSFTPGQRVFVKSEKKEAVFVGMVNGLCLVKFDDGTSLNTVSQNLD